MATPKECKCLAESDFPVGVVSKHAAWKKVDLARVSFNLAVVWILLDIDTGV